MLIKFKQIIKSLILLRKAKFIFKNPENEPIVVFDASSSKSILHCLRGLNFFLLETRVKEIKKIYLSKKILFFLIKNFFNYSLKINYLLALISLINPKVVITRIDTSREFHILSKILFNKIKFISLMQGMRLLPNSNTYKSDTSIDSLKKYFIPEFYVFSKSDVNFFRSINLKVHNYSIVGSLNSARALDYFKTNKIKTNLKYDFCFIPSLEYSFSRLIVKYLHDFCKENKYSYVIAADGDLKDSREVNFLNTFVKNEKINLIKNIRKKYTSYKLILNSRVIIGTASTLLKEAIGLDKKILLINGFLNKFPNKNLFYYKKDRETIKEYPYDNSYMLFKKYAEKILKMRFSYYSKLFKNKNLIMPKKLDTQKIIKKKILHYI